SNSAAISPCCRAHGQHRELHSFPARRSSDLDSELALWQAKTVQQQLEHLGHKTQLIPVKSTGDIILDKPIYELGIVGVFTRILRSEEHTSELQSRENLVCRLLLEKNKTSILA